MTPALGRTHLLVDALLDALEVVLDLLELLRVRSLAVRAQDDDVLIVQS